MQLKKGIAKICMPAPAKLNLFLGVSGLRSDGFHELLTVMAKINLRDIIEIELVEQVGSLTCTCSGNENLNRQSNIAEKAVIVWRQFTGIQNGISIRIEKKIPDQAGLGGGSSDAVATLLALNMFMEEPLSFQDLVHLSSQIGSDCPSFLMKSFCVARGRGEILSDLNPRKSLELSKKEILLFKPPLGFSTLEIFELMAEGKLYSESKLLESLMQDWQSGALPTDEFLMNDLEKAVFKKYLFLPELFKVLSSRFGLNPRLSGSGSCCFCLGPKLNDWGKVKETIKELWGHDSFVKIVNFV